MPFPIATSHAIGATVRVPLAGRTPVAHLTAGDGYQASNERQLILGLGDRDRIPELHVTWPAGRQHTFRDLPADRHVVLIEGQESAVVLRRTFCAY